MYSSYTRRMDKENINLNLLVQRGRDHTPRHALTQVRIPFPNEEFYKSDEFGDKNASSFNLRDNSSLQDLEPSKLCSEEGKLVSDINVNNDADGYKKCAVDVACNIKRQPDCRTLDTSQTKFKDEQNARIRGFAESFTWNSSSVKDCGSMTAVHVSDKHASERFVLTNDLNLDHHHLRPTSLTTGVSGRMGEQSSNNSLRSYHSTPDCNSAFQDISIQNGQMSNVRARRKRVSGLPMRVPAVTLAKYREEEEEEKDSWYSHGLAPLSPDLQMVQTDGVQECDVKKCDVQQRLDIDSSGEYMPQQQSEASFQKHCNPPALSSANHSDVAKESLRLHENAVKAPGTSNSTASVQNALSNVAHIQNLPHQAVSSHCLLAPGVKMHDQGHVFVKPPVQTPALQPHKALQATIPAAQPMLTPVPMVMHPQVGYSFTPVADNRPNYYTPYSQMPHPGVSNIITVNGRTYSVLSLLGKGGSSKVYQVYEMEKKKLLAIKCVKLEDADESVSLAYKNEITLLQKLQHSDRVIKLYDYEYNEDKECLYAVIEKGDTDLASMIRNYAKNGQITSEMIKFYWSEMLRAVAVIHKAGIVHSDLKPANFLLVSGKLKLIDFGIARSIQTDMTSVFKDVQEGTFNYMSPEAIQDTAQVPEVDEKGRRRPQIKISVKSDVWSLGCILYNLVYGRTPFQHIPQPLVKMQAITNPKHAISFPSVADNQLIDVMQKCLVRDPKQRPSIEELLSHPYLTSGTSEAPKDSSDVKSTSVLDQLASLTPRSLVRVYQEFSKMLTRTQNDSQTTSMADRNDASC